MCLTIMRLAPRLLPLVLAAALAGCGLGCANCQTLPASDSGPPGDGGGDGGGPCDPADVCGADCCAADETCVGNACLTVVGECAAEGLCPEDGRCIDDLCIPWSEFSPLTWDGACGRDVPPGVLRPMLQCAWEYDAASSHTSAYYAVRHTPLSVDFHLGDIDTPMGPSIIVIGDATYTEGVPRVCESEGSLIVLDGRTCAELYMLDAADERVLATVTPAAADLDGDGRPEIVAAGPDGGLKAFRYDETADDFVKLWDSVDESGAASDLGIETCLWGGITVADLDGGAPEIFFHGAAHDTAGQIIGRIPGYQFISWGNPMVVVDADLDGAPEVLEGYGTFDYAAGAGFTIAAGWVGVGGPGFIAVADFGDFSGAAGDAPGRPEVVVVNASVRVQTVLGEVVFSAAGGYGTGGPPTVADFDGDGAAEFGVAFGDGYVVYDLACAGAPAGCAGDGILWSSVSQDLSSAKTGSSVFDFNGDGRAEVIYGDECFVRVYDGPSGDVLFSQGRFSSTWEENAIVADVDGDSSAEIVLSASSSCNTVYCGEWDESFVGLPCDTADDCPGGACDEHLCRCASDAECGGAFRCNPPPVGTPGTGDVCRTKHEGCEPGIRVYRDARDRWAGSRRLWNQHAYYVTNVADDGTIPAFDSAVLNWATAGLNNFRMNVQGVVGLLPAADLTVKEVAAGPCAAGVATLSATVCNRGAAGADAGVRVVFVESGTGAVLCEAVTESFLEHGFCATVACEATIGPDGLEAEALVNPDEAVAECAAGNNASLPAFLECAG